MTYPLPVLWKLTPLFAQWLAWEGNWLFKGGFLSKGSTVLELGCGISGVVAMMLAPRVGRYVATDQEYVFKCLRRNLEANAVTRKVTGGRKYGKRKKKKEEVVVDADVELLALDWETSVLEGMEGLLGFDGIGEGKGLDMVLACDCVYNEALIGPFVRTCGELCRFSGRMGGGGKRCVWLLSSCARMRCLRLGWRLSRGGLGCGECRMRCWLMGLRRARDMWFMWECCVMVSDSALLVLAMEWCRLRDQRSYCASQAVDAARKLLSIAIVNRVRFLRYIVPVELSDCHGLDKSRSGIF